jgi:hypothetical protein
MRTLRFPDEVLPPASRYVRRAGGPEDDERVKAGQFLLSALADARDELARRLSLVNAGVAVLSVASPVFGLVTLTANAIGGPGFADVERVIQAVDQVLSTTGPRLLERIGNGEASRLESLRTLVGNVTTTIEQTIPDVTFMDSQPMRFLREVVAQSFQDLGNFVRELPDKLPGVGIGLGALLVGIAALIFATR